MKLLTCLVLLISPFSYAEDTVKEPVLSQTYKITFQSNWNAIDHKKVPGPAHFSPVVAVVHNSNYDLLPVGTVAGKGLEMVAELGNPDLINKEITAAMTTGNVSETLNTKNMFISSQLSQSFELTVTNHHPYISFASMIAPSPDWIVGLSNLKLYSKEAGFYSGINKPMPLLAIDAGTENGDVGGNFSLMNRPTQPQGAISILTGSGFDAPFAYITIEPVAKP